MNVTLIADRLELPMYSLSEAALYLRVPRKTLVQWVFGGDRWTTLQAAKSKPADGALVAAMRRISPLIRVAGTRPQALSFMNLLECHMLAAMRSQYDLRLPKIRRALALLNKTSEFKHPLIEQPLYTKKIDMFFLEDIDKLGKLPRDRQIKVFEIFEAHLERIEYDKGLFKFYPFVRERSAAEPKLIVISPEIGFGKPVIAGTGISTAVIASRFNARESVPELAKEYGLEEKQVEEAIRWETRAVAA
jgi:uncharacterized protein (DUF433 family)